MKHNELKTKILNILNNKQYKFNYSRTIKNNTELYNEILSQTNFNFEISNIDLKTRIYFILNDISSEKDIPKCKICGKVILDKNALSLYEYPKICSSKSCQNKFKHQRTVEVMKEKYGVENPGQMEDHFKKCSKTKLEHYGDANAFNFGSNDFKNVIKEKYGVDNAAKLDNIKDKSKQTCLEKYGVEYSFQAETTKEKIKTTSLEKYGCENPGGSKESIEKIKNTFFEKYGNYPLALDEFKEKGKKTSLERYGVDHPMKSSLIKMRMPEVKSAYEKLLNSNKSIPLFSFEEYVARNDNLDKSVLFRCLNCGKEFTSNCNGHIHLECPDCFPISINSEPQQEIYLFLKNECNFEIIENSRSIISPLELDIYIPEKNIAIEFDGLYWHSEKCGKDSKYHLNKTKLCEEKNIQLIHIFDDEWRTKQDIVKSRLKNLLGLSENKIYARNCIIKEIDSKLSKQFQEENHIQGGIYSKVNLGLFYNNELVSLMTFSKPRFDKKHDWELVRFCNKLNYNVVGAASKLLKYFERNYNPKNIVSYADRCWSKGNLYIKLGFELDHISPPDYWYTNSLIRESRIKYQKHKLSKILANFDETKSEVQNMLDNGFARIWNCGNLVMEKNYEA
jgi:hypothetical protein